MNRAHAYIPAAIVVALFSAAAWYAADAHRSLSDDKAKPQAAENNETEKPSEEPALKKFMRAKLEASNQILEGLVTEDFELIAKGANRLETMSRAEQWRVSNDAMYRQHSAQFRRVAAQLKKTAKEKKLEGAALAWMEATMSCLECHKHVRGMMIAEAALGPVGNHRK